MPARELADEFADTEIVTVPAPVTELPPVTVIQAALLLAVQVQPAGAFTVTDVEVAVAPTVRTVVDSVYLHDEAAWVTVTGLPAIVSVAVRVLVVEFGGDGDGHGAVARTRTAAGN